MTRAELKAPEWTSLSVDEAFKRRDEAKAAGEACSKEIMRLTFLLGEQYDKLALTRANYDFADKMCGLAIQAEEAK